MKSVVVVADSDITLSTDLRCCWFATARLSAYPLRAEDRDLLCTMHDNADVMATLGGIRSQEQTDRWLAANRDHWEQHGYGIWVFRDKEDGRFIGRGGLRHVMIEGTSEMEMAYALMPEFWGRGLATEIARALIQWSRERLERHDLIGVTLTGNSASRHVLEKAGFRYEREFARPAGPHVLYRLV